MRSEFHLFPITFFFPFHLIHLIKQKMRLMCVFVWLHSFEPCTSVQAPLVCTKVSYTYAIVTVHEKILYNLRLQLTKI